MELCSDITKPPCHINRVILKKVLLNKKVTDLFTGLKEKEHFHIEGSGCSNKVMLYMYNNMYLGNVI